MGSKFAHISILDSDVKQVIHLVKNTLTDSATSSLWHRENEAKYSGNVLQQFVVHWNKMTLEHTPYFVGPNNKWVTVCSENFGIENVEDNAIKMSRVSLKLFLVIGNFDDDVFLLSLIKNGEVLTRHISESYEMLMVRNRGTIVRSAELLDILDKKGTLNFILKIDNAMEKIKELENLLHMRLWLLNSDKITDDWQMVTI